MDGSRQLEKAHFIRYMAGEGADEEQAKSLWRSVDYNHNGSVTLSEFRDWSAKLLKLDNLEDTFLK